MRRDGSSQRVEHADTSTHIGCISLRIALWYAAIQVVVVSAVVLVKLETTLAAAVMIVGLALTLAFTALVIGNHVDAMRRDCAKMRGMFLGQGMRVDRALASLNQIKCGGFTEATNWQTCGHAWCTAYRELRGLPREQERDK